MFEHRVLLPVFNTLLLGILPEIAAYIAGRSYLNGGSVTVLFMGCGMLSIGLGAISAGWMIRASNGANVNVMVFNTGALLSSLFHAGAAISFHFGGNRPDDAGRRKLRIVSAYGSIVLFVICFCFAALVGLIPPFFIEGVDPTPLRQVVLGSATFLYFISPVLLITSYLKSKSDFVYWYSLCLAMVCIDLVGSFIQPAVGSPMGWLARSAGGVGGIFAAVAVISAIRDAKAQGTSLEQTISGSFHTEELYYKRTLLPLLPIPIMLFLLVVLLSMDLQTVFEPPGLYALLNIVFLTILPLIVSYYATRGYLRSGLFPMLILGSGTLALGLSGVLSALIMHWQGGGPDAAMTIFSWLSFVSAIFHLAGGVSVFTGVHPDRDTRHKELILALTYIGIAAVAVLLTDMVLKGIIPTFFVRGQGPSALRQVLVGIITVMSIFCGLLFLSVYFFSRAKFLYWYSLAMFVFTTALISYMFVMVIGSPIAWLCRSGLYLAGIYLFIAVISASRELRSKGESLADGISGLFLHHLESLVEDRTLQLTRAKEDLQTAYSQLQRTNAELENCGGRTNHGVAECCRT